ncbi:MAG: hypothetical protein L3J96_02335, partial [Thermoplasmata archaeon]|nr:hypothetical protein [Thermoplasmata archaeon]
PLQVSIEITTQGANNPAVQLPSVMDTPAFLVAHDIHFVLLPTAPQYTQTINYYEAEFGFRVGFSNSGWTVLEG